MPADLGRARTFFPMLAYAFLAVVAATERARTQPLEQVR